MQLTVSFSHYITTEHKIRCSTPSCAALVNSYWQATSLLEALDTTPIICDNCMLAVQAIEHTPRPKPKTYKIYTCN